MAQLASDAFFIVSVMYFFSAAFPLFVTCSVYMHVMLTNLSKVSTVSFQLIKHLCISDDLIHSFSVKSGTAFVALTVSFSIHIFRIEFILIKLSTGSFKYC